MNLHKPFQLLLHLRSILSSLRLALCMVYVNVWKRSSDERSLYQKEGEIGNQVGHL
jgi:hypothetical protein